MLALNVTYLSKLAFIVGLWCCVRALNPIRESPINAVFEVVGHGLFALLAGLELGRWSNHTDVMSSEMAFGVFSAVLAIQGCVLIWYGLITRCPYRRYAGFVLFGLAAGKTIFIDTFQLEAVYRIVSWLGSGALLVVAALLYQRYAPRLLGAQELEEDQ
jgi:uncharacterized membrane protein